MSNLTQNSPINPARGGRSDQMKKLEALFGGGNTTTSRPTLGGGRTTSVPSRNNIEARFAAAFKTAPDASSDGNKNEGNTKGTDLPNSLGPKVPSAYKIRLERIRTAPNENELNSAIETFLTSHELPSDIEVILKVLRHPNEQFVRKGLAELVGMVSRKEITGTSLVMEALTSLETRQFGNETKSYIDGLKAMLTK